MKRFISFVLALAMVVYALPMAIIANEMTIPSFYSVGSNAVSKPSMDSDNAAMFIGFITNNGRLKEEQIKSSDFYKLITNTYVGDDEYSKLLGLLTFIETNTAQMAKQASNRKEVLSQDIIKYLDKSVPSNGSIGLTEEIINEYKNQASKKITEAIKNAVNNLLPTSADSLYSVTDVYDSYMTLSGSAAKAKRIVEYTAAAMEGIFLVLNCEYAGRYDYFQSYLGNRGSYSSPNDQIFETIMSYNQLACADNNWLAGFLDVFTFITHKDNFTNHFELLDYWAEYTYQLEAYCNSLGAQSSGESGGGTDNPPIDNPPDVPTIKIIAQGDCRATDEDLVQWTLDENGVLAIDGVGKMQDYGYNQAPWYSYKESIKSILIKNHVKNIGNHAFHDCNAATSVVISPDVTSIGDGAFSFCKGLTSITIPTNVTSIGDSAFSSCTGLSSITIPNNVTSIGDYVFFGSVGLTSITISNNITSIGSGAFFDCWGLTSITIPTSVTSIGDKAFYNCFGLTSITIPNSVTSIGDNAFYYCTSLTSITIPNKITSISSEAFRSCRSLTSITIPGSVTSIGTRAFYECTGLTSASIPNSVISIGDEAFYRCNSLTSITIPSSVTSIGKEAFLDCDSLISVAISNSVTSIGIRAFCSCNSLASITIPDSVTILPLIEQDDS